VTRTAIVAAMPGELKPLVRGWQRERRNGVDLWRWRFDEGEWIAACAGAGVEAATRAFAEVERAFAEAEKPGPVSFVISTGWAGALSEEFEPSRAYFVAGVIDARCGERFRASYFAERAEALKGHGLSRAAEPPKTDAALAAGVTEGDKTATPQGLKPPASNESSGGAAEAVPFQDDCWLVTSPKVADAAEKQRLAAAYGAGLVDMEAAGVARLAQMRGIPFYCVKGISDGYRDKLPDFNRFISAEGGFRTIPFVFFALVRPWYWPALMRMGENSRKAAQSIKESILDLLDERAYIRERNGYPDLRR
jgi:adenosylhomocysteine nucleosidase